MTTFDWAPYLDPDETGTTVENSGQAETLRHCPFRHVRAQCSCELRPGYWADEDSKPDELPEDLLPTVG